MSTIDDVVRRSMQYTQRSKVARIWPLRPDRGELSRIPIEGVENIERSLSLGRGTIILTAHVGYGRLIKHVLKSRGYSAVTLGLVPKRPNESERDLSRLNSFVRFSLLRVPYFSASLDTDLPASINLRPVLGALEKNAIICLAAEGRGARRDPSFAVIFGRAIPFRSGIFEIAQKTGCQVLPTFAVDGDPGSSPCKVVVQEPLSLETTREGAIEEFIARVEGVIREYPHLYSWRRHRQLKRASSAASLAAAWEESEDQETDEEAGSDDDEG